MADTEDLRLSKEEEEWRTLGAAWITEHTLSTLFRRLSEERQKYYDIVKEYNDRMVEARQQRSDLLVSRGEVQDDLSRLQRVCRELNGDVATLHNEGEDARAEAAECTDERDDARASHEAAQSLLITHSEVLTKERDAARLKANRVADEKTGLLLELELLKASNPLGLCGKHRATIRCDMPCPMCTLDTLEEGEHVVDFGGDTWTLKHPLECRETGLFDCPVNKAIREGGPPMWFRGRYRITVRENGTLRATAL